MMNYARERLGHMRTAHGRYHDDIKRYLDAFGDRVLVIVLEDFVRDVAKGMTPVWEFLGLAPVDIGEARAVNAHTAPRNRFVAAVMRHDLAWTVGRRLLPAGIRHRVRDAALAPAEKPPVAGRLRRRLADYYRRGRGGDGAVARALASLGERSELIL